MKETIKSYKSANNANKALSLVGEAALQKASELITKGKDGMFTFSLEKARAVQETAEEKAEQNLKDSIEGYDVHGLTHCPSCNIDLRNGVAAHGDEVDGNKLVRHKKYVYACLNCGSEFGPELTKAKAKPDVKVDTKTKAKAIVKIATKTDTKAKENADNPRQTMKTSLKLDRRIISCDVATGEQWEWVNAHQMWKENPEWMTSGQQDALTAKLYAAAKKGEKIEVTINDRIFYLASV